MGICLHQKYINNATLDDFNLKSKEEINNKNNKGKNEDNKEGKILKDKILLSPNANINDKKNIISINDKFISYKIQSRYKSKFFNSPNNTNNKSPKINANELQNFYYNSNDNFDNLIHFTYLSDKKGNLGGSTATNSNIK